jgi:hypothetical protein
MDQLDTVKYLGVEISRKGISKLYGARVERFIARDEVRELRLKRGNPGERGWLELALGVIFLGVAGLQILGLLSWLMNGGTQTTSNILVMLALLCFGSWLVWDATHPQWYLEVQTLEKTYKLAFNDKIDQAVLRDFLQYGKLVGYAIDAALLEGMGD